MHALLRCVRARGEKTHEQINNGGRSEPRLSICLSSVFRRSQRAPLTGKTGGFFLLYFTILSFLNLLFLFPFSFYLLLSKSYSLPFRLFASSANEDASEDVGVNDLSPLFPSLSKQKMPMMGLILPRADFLFPRFVCGERNLTTRGSLRLIHQRICRSESV